MSAPSVSIMLAPWAPERVANVAKLRALLPMAKVVEATQGAGVWDTARRAWLQATEGTHLVIQDDAVIPRKLLAQVSGATWYGKPDRLHRHYPSAIALSLPAELCSELVAFGDGLPEIQRRHDNVVFVRFLKAKGIQLAKVPIVGSAGFSSLLGH